MPYTTMQSVTISKLFKLSKSVFIRIRSLPIFSWIKESNTRIWRKKRNKSHFIPVPQAAFSIRVGSDCKALAGLQGDAFFSLSCRSAPGTSLGSPWNRKGGKSLETTVVVHLTGLLWHVSFHPTASGVCWEPGEAPSETPNLQWEEATLCFDFVSVQKTVVKEVTPMAISAVLCSKCFQLCWNIFQRIQVLEIRNSIKYRNVFLGVKGHLTLQFNNLLFF